MAFAKTFAKSSSLFGIVEFVVVYAWWRCLLKDSLFSIFFLLLVAQGRKNVLSKDGENEEREIQL